ncbi:MAG: ABC transporter substrate-binding protein, partial [Candidatus Aminicenantes bacterium]|nr:ABC transporter substrate-binding protein [Candidatus Aminicenantes bacterium]
VAEKLTSEADHAGALMQELSRLFDFGVMLAWLYGTLDAFRILRPLRAWLAAAFAWKLNFGNIAITVGGTVLFALSVYLSFWGSLVRTPVSYEPVEAAGGRNVASGALPDHLGTAGLTISLEKLLVWDPDVILIQGNYPPGERQVTVEGVLRDPRLASLRAVRTGRVHYTFGFWYWWDPALVLVETLHLARLFHPGSAPGGDLVRTGDEIFKDIYGTEGLFSALCRVLECHAWTTR